MTERRVVDHDVFSRNTLVLEILLQDLVGRARILIITIMIVKLHRYKNRTSITMFYKLLILNVLLFLHVIPSSIRPIPSMVN